MSTILDALRRAQGSSSKPGDRGEDRGEEAPMVLGENLDQPPSDEAPGKGPSRFSALIVVVLGLGLGALVARLAVVDTASKPGDATVSSLEPSVAARPSPGRQAALPPLGPTVSGANEPAKKSQPQAARQAAAPVATDPAPAATGLAPVATGPAPAATGLAPVAAGLEPVAAGLEPVAAAPKPAREPLEPPEPELPDQAVAAVASVRAATPVPTLKTASAEIVPPLPSTPPRELLPEPPDDAPKVWVLFIKWSPDPAGRVVSLRNEGGSIAIAREGDIVRGMLVASIRPEGVEFEFRKKAFLLVAGR